MTALILTVFVLVYLGMILGGLPFLKLDRTGVALLGAIALIGNPQNMLIGETLQLSFGGDLAQAAPPVLLGLLATWGLMALAGAGLLLSSRRLHSRRMLGLVDWELLVLFMGLFVVNQALQQTGLPAQAVAGLAAAGVDLEAPAPLFAASFLLSNLVSNVPAVMLLLPLADHPQGGVLLALSSTLAGNLFIVGSIATIIVVQAAERRGIHIGWRTHARVGVPVTLATLALATGCLWLCGP